MAARPLGALVPRRPTSHPAHKILHGTSIDVIPLSASHSGAFAALASPENAWLWDYMPEAAPTASTLGPLIASKSASQDPLFFAVSQAGTGAVAGYCALMRQAAGDGSVEIGHIMYMPWFQRTRGATEVIFLLLREVFEGLGYRRAEWKCNDLNAASVAAAKRYGFVYEGTFRQHMVVKGRNRDTAWFAMCDGEWEGVKAAFEAWLDEGNFDAAGRQIKGLAQCREEAKKA